MSLSLSPLISLALQVEPAQQISAGLPGRRFIPVNAGTVSGTFTGHVLPGGGDWQTIAVDGSIEIAAHHVLDISGHGLVEVRSEGLRHADPETLAALARNELVDPSRYYFRTAIRFKTSAPGLLRLNHILAVARGRREQGLVTLDIFEVG
ncbi:MAG: hypothetical protein RL490_900 [Pseudomonadota bacterium]